MVEGRPPDVLHELRMIRFSLFGLLAAAAVFMGVRLSEMAARPPGPHAAELQGIQGELRLLREELGLLRAAAQPPPRVIPVIPPAGKGFGAGGEEAGKER